MIGPEELNQVALPHTAEISRTTVALFKHVSGTRIISRAGCCYRLKIPAFS